MWDVPASARADLTDTFAADASCALLVFDLEDRSSFGTAKRWHQILTSGEARVHFVYEEFAQQVTVIRGSSHQFSLRAHMWRR